jgi:hypothetical protein
MKFRVGSAFVAGIAGVVNVGLVALKTFAVIGLAAIAQTVAFGLTAAAYLAIPTGLVALCIFFPHAIPFVVGGVVVVALGIALYCQNRKINALEKKITDFEKKLEERLPKRLDVSLPGSADSSRRCSLDDASVASQDGARQNAVQNADAENAGQNADADAAAGQNAGDAGQNAGDAGQNPDADQQLQ